MMVANDSNRLLLVDDDVVFCEVLARALERRGFAVSKAGDPQSALEAARQFAVDLAVVDLCLGNESGLALIERLLALNPSMRIVVLTGYASVATAVEAIKLGATHYLTKPTEPDEIVARVGYPFHPGEYRLLCLAPRSLGDKFTGHDNYPDRGGGRPMPFLPTSETGHDGARPLDAATQNDDLLTPPACARIAPGYGSWRRAFPAMACRSCVRPLA